MIDLRGDIDAQRRAALDDAYARGHGGERHARSLLNFAGVDYINSTGIALIVGLLAQARAQRVEVAACGLSDHYREIFEITRLADFMTDLDTEDGAVTRRGLGGDDDLSATMSRRARGLARRAASSTSGARSPPRARTR